MPWLWLSSIKSYYSLPKEHLSWPLNIHLYSIFLSSCLHFQYSWPVHQWSDLSFAHAKVCRRSFLSFSFRLIKNGDAAVPQALVILFDCLVNHLRHLLGFRRLGWCLYGTVCIKGNNTSLLGRVLVVAEASFGFSHFRILVLVAKRRYLRQSLPIGLQMRPRLI